MATVIKTVQVHGPGGPLGNHGQNPVINVEISIGDFVRNTRTSASCKINYVTLVNMGSGRYFGYYIELGARLCSSTASDDESLIQSLFYKSPSPNIWNTGEIGKGTYNGTVLKTYNSSGSPINNPGVTSLTCSTLDDTVQLRLYIRSNCDCQSQSVGPNGWVKVVADEITDNFRLSAPTISIVQGGSAVSSISVGESVNIVATSSESPDTYTFEYKVDGGSYIQLQSNSNSTVSNFTHSLSRNLSDFGSSNLWPRTIYFRVKVSKSLYTDSVYSSDAALQVIYNPTQVLSFSCQYAGQTPQLGIVSLYGKFNVSITPYNISQHFGNFKRFDVLITDSSNNVLSTLYVNEQTSPSGNSYELSDINQRYSLIPGTDYKLKFLLHYYDDTVSSSSQYYGEYPNTADDSPLEEYSSLFRIGQSPDKPEMIYPSSLNEGVTANQSPRILFRVHNPSSIQGLGTPEINRVKVYYNDGIVDEGVIVNGEILNDSSSNNFSGNLGSFLSIKSSLKGDNGYVVMYQLRPMTGNWFIPGSDVKVLKFKISCVNFYYTESAKTEITNFTYHELTRPAKGSKILALHAANLGTLCRKIFDSYINLKTSYDDEGVDGADYIYGRGSLSSTYTYGDFYNKYITSDRVYVGSQSYKLLMQEWYKCLMMPDPGPSATIRKYGIYDKLASYGPIRKIPHDYNKTLELSVSGYPVNSNTLSNYYSYYVGNIYDIIIDLLKNIL